ncbi:MAG: DNA-binding protein, partial [Pygmaiobacter sp.]
DDLSLAEIADNFGITRQGVRDAIKRGEAIILDLEGKVGFAARYRAVQEGVVRIGELAREIEFSNGGTYSGDAAISRNTAEILAVIDKISE